MDIRQLTTDYAVSPQIAAEDVSAIAQAGFRTIICNRPDEEVPPSHQAAAIEAAAHIAGIQFVNLPLTMHSLTQDTVAQHLDLVARSDGPIFAYCNSGTRSSVMWALGAAQSMEVDEILSAARGAGYALDTLRPTLEAARAAG